MKSTTFEVIDALRNRTIPLRVYRSTSPAPAPVVLFSHGLGGSRDNNPYLGQHWAKRGYVVVIIQHPGSDETLWKTRPPAERMQAMKAAASARNLIARANDVPVVIDALTLWNTEENHSLHGKLDIKHIGMSGHSYGAVTTQAVAGQSMGGAGSRFMESRLTAAVMFSPSPPKLGSPAAAFRSVKLPCLLMTGTNDNSPIGNTTPKDRLNVFPHLTQAPAWQIVFDQATHMSFGDRNLQGKSENDNRYHTPILALSTAFWDAELRNNAEAKTWLSSDVAKSVLTSEDVWQMNAMAKERR